MPSASTIALRAAGGFLAIALVGAIALVLILGRSWSDDCRESASAGSGKLYLERIGPPPGGQQEARSAGRATGTKERGRLVYTPPMP